MFNKLRTPVLGLVENMSGFECRHCGQREEIFGSGGARRFAAAGAMPVLRGTPLCTEIPTPRRRGHTIRHSTPAAPTDRQSSPLRPRRVPQRAARSVDAPHVGAL